jgi:hypothetical protein
LVFSGFDSGIYHGPDQIDFPKAAAFSCRKFLSESAPLLFITYPFSSDYFS